MELDEIPAEIAKRIGEVKAELYLIDEDICDIKKALEAGNVTATLPRIDHWRTDLAKLDQRMAEYGAILAEYQKASSDLYLAKQEVAQQSSTNQQLESDIAESQQVDDEEYPPEFDYAKEKEIDYDLIAKGLEKEETNG